MYPYSQTSYSNFSNFNQIPEESHNQYEDSICGNRQYAIGSQFQNAMNTVSNINQNFQATSPDGVYDTEGQFYSSPYNFQQSSYDDVFEPITPLERANQHLAVQRHGTAPQIKVPKLFNNKSPMNNSNDFTYSGIEKTNLNHKVSFDFDNMHDDIMNPETTQGSMYGSKSNLTLKQNVNFRSNFENGFSINARALLKQKPTLNFRSPIDQFVQTCPNYAGMDQMQVTFDQQFQHNQISLNQENINQMMQLVHNVPQDLPMNNVDESPKKRGRPKKQAVVFKDTTMTDCQKSAQVMNAFHNIDDSDEVTNCSPTKNIRNLATASSSLNIEYTPIKTPKKPAQVYVYTEQDLVDLPVKCDHCERRFRKPESLGGHVSKAHPGKSQIYAKKMQRRIQREPDRQLLAKAKEILLQQDPTINLIKQRALVTKTKNNLKKSQKLKNKQIFKQRLQIIE